MFGVLQDRPDKTNRAGLTRNGSWSAGRPDSPEVIQDAGEPLISGALQESVDFPQLVLDELPDDAIAGGGDDAPDREGLQTNNPGWPGYSSGGAVHRCRARRVRPPTLRSWRDAV